MKGNHHHVASGQKQIAHHASRLVTLICLFTSAYHKTGFAMETSEATCNHVLCSFLGLTFPEPRVHSSWQLRTGATSRPPSASPSPAVVWWHRSEPEEAVADAAEVEGAIEAPPDSKVFMTISRSRNARTHSPKPDAAGSTPAGRPLRYLSSACLTLHGPCGTDPVGN